MRSRLEPERWLRQKEAFQKALDLDAADREELLARLRAEDAALADAVAAMLAAHETDDGALDAPALPERPADPVIGLDVDGKYRIEHRLGRGGMGSVYRATHLWTGRAVAVKIIAPEFVRLPEFVERFKREARAAGRLRHPNVVNVTDFGFTKLGEGRLAYLVMEYLDGRTLGDLLAERGPLPLGFAAEVIEQVCLAVDAAHASGVLHRDLKPDNIWLEPDGRGGFTVKVLDFGIARLRETGGDVEARAPEPRPMRAVREETRPTRRLPWAAKATLAGPLPSHDEAAPLREPTAVAVDARTVPPERSRASMVLGTPAYMSPEQCRGDGADERSDVYGLGIVAYEMLAGKTPFSGDLETLLVKHGEVPPPPLRSVRRDLPRPVEAVVRGALAKSPGERPPTAGAFAAAFAAALRGVRFLEREAAARLAQHRVPLWRLQLRAHALFVALATLAVMALSVRWPLAGPPDAVVWALWAVPLALLLLASDFGAAACAIALERPPSGAAGELRIEEHSTRLWRRAHVVTAAAVRGWARPSGVFAPLAAAVEAVGPARAFDRSRVLATLPGSYATTAFLRRMVASLFVLVVVAVTFSMIVPGDRPFELILIAYLAAALAGLGAASVLLSRASIARAALYLSARRAAGETLRSRDTSEIAPPGNARRRLALRVPVLVASGLVSIFLLSAFELLVVPPMTPVPPRRPSVVEPVPAAENAWEEYGVATKLVSADAADLFASATLDALLDFAVGKSNELDDAKRSAVDRSLPALDRMMNGARRPRAQFTAEPLSDISPYPSYVAMRALGLYAAARSRIFMDAGREEEARTLLLAAYRMAVDVGETRLGTTGFAMSQGIRWVLVQTIARWAWAYPNADHAALARGVESLDARFASFADVLAVDDEVLINAASSVLLGGQTAGRPWAHGQPFATLAAFPGLRERAYLQLLDLVDANAEAKRYAVESWDADGFALIESREAMGIYAGFNILRPDLALAREFVSSEHRAGWLPRMMEYDYMTRAGSAGARALLACAAYCKRHGTFPLTLDGACADIGVSVPRDPITSKEARYRIDDRTPVVWLDGTDRVDDGGVIPWTSDLSGYGNRSKHSDMIYRMGVPLES